VDRWTLEDRVDRIEADPPIRLDSVDLTIRDPAPLRARFEEIFAYIAAVEGAVPQNVADVTTLLPGLGTQELRFLSAWSSQELAHAAVFDALRAELGLAPDRPVPDGDATAPPVRPRRSFRMLGTLAANRWLHDVLTMLYLSRGAMHEHMTYDCYRHLGAHFAALGEDALVQTVTEPIRRQEAAHLGYYRMAAMALRATLSPAQLATARWITVRTYAPVGATPGGRDAATRVCAGLAGDDLDDVLEAVEGVASQLLGEPGRPLPPFVHAAMSVRRGTGAGLEHREVAPWA
jgi:hypothetical protein